jgi:hypothetical protein
MGEASADLRPPAIAMSERPVYWQQSVVGPDGVTLPLAVDGVVTVHVDS